MQAGHYHTNELDILLNDIRKVMQRKLGGDKIASILTRIIRDECEELNSVSFEDGVFVVNELRY